MSGLVPPTPHGGAPDEEPTGYLDPEQAVVERRARWEVEAAHWRARSLAEACFPGAVRSRLAGQRHQGRWRGLLHLDVRFDDLERHRRREARFLAAVRDDPVLARVALVYVVGAAED